MAAPGLSIDGTLGAVFIGFAVACFIYGILVTQIFSYFWRYPLDRPVYKVLVSCRLDLTPILLSNLSRLFLYCRQCTFAAQDLH